MKIVGIRNPIVVKYAGVHEAEHAFIAAPTDANAHGLSKGLAEDAFNKLAEAFMEKPVKRPREAKTEEQVAKELQTKIKARIEDLGLVDTGRMRDSVEMF